MNFLVALALLSQPVGTPTEPPNGEIAYEILSRSLVAVMVQKGHFNGPDDTSPADPNGWSRQSNWQSDIDNLREICRAGLTDPPLWHIDRFPATEFCQAWQCLAIERYHYCEKQQAWEPDRAHLWRLGSKVNGAIAEIWQAAVSAQCEYNQPFERRAHLRKIRDIMGPELYEERAWPRWLY